MSDAAETLHSRFAAAGNPSKGKRLGGLIQGDAPNLTEPDRAAPLVVVKDEAGC